jgi:hypothetical protein
VFCSVSKPSKISSLTSSQELHDSPQNRSLSLNPLPTATRRGDAQKVGVTYDSFITHRTLMNDLAGDVVALYSGLR